MNKNYKIYIDENKCKEYLDALIGTKTLAEHDNQIRAEVIDEFHKTKIDVLNWLIKRQSEGYGTTNGELLDYIYDYKLKEQNK